MRGRLALLAAVAVLGGLALSACQNDPAMAARANGQVLTEAELEAQYADALADSPVPPPASSQHSAITRQDVVFTFVLREACQKYRAAKGFDVPAVTQEQYAQFAAGSDVTNTRYAHDTADMFACMNAALQTVEPVQPTTQELQDFFRRGQQAGAYPADANFAQYEDEVRITPGVAEGVAAKRLVDQMLRDASTEVNPRYWPIEVPLRSFSNGDPAITTQIGGNVSDAVKH